MNSNFFNLLIVIAFFLKVVNFHAIGHLVNDTEGPNCELCAFYNSNSDKDSLTFPPNSDITTLVLPTAESRQSGFTSQFSVIRLRGNYFNKPPPSL